ITTQHVIPPSTTNNETIAIASGDTNLSRIDFKEKEECTPYDSQFYTSDLSVERSFKILGEKTLENLAKTGITDIVVLDTLSQSQIRHMMLVGRRRLIQILSFTIKEFRELTKLTDLLSMLNKEDFN
ncbi:unnamed protein product, partial [Rotaria sordida]